MPKINQEEYEVLKGLNDRWRWIARDKSGKLHIYDKKPKKFASAWAFGRGSYLSLSNETFQFIQWEDKEAHNIAKLVDGYESEDKEVKKQELIENIKSLAREASQQWPHEEMVELPDVLREIDRLGELEILSLEWIDMNKRDDYYGEWVYTSDLQNLLVPKQERAKVPRFMADYLLLVKQDIELEKAAYYAVTHSEPAKQKKEYDWIRENFETFTRAWLDGFTIADEDEELWKPIENYEGLYEVSDKGNVRSLDRDVQYKKTDFTMKIKGVGLKPNILKKGYLQVGLSKSGKRKGKLVHRLVMNAFNPTTDESLQINHIDGNKENNEVSNLEWVTAIENTNHAYDIGLRDDTIGNNRKLTEDEVLEIIDLYETGNYTQKELGNKYNVGRNTIGEILLGKTWGWLTGITRGVEKEPLYRARLKVVTYKGIAAYLRTQSSSAEERLKALEIGSKYIHKDYRHLSEFTEEELKGLNIWDSDQWEIEEVEE